MRREIRFRAWDPERKLMLEVIGIKYFYVNEEYDKVHYPNEEPLVECAWPDTSRGPKCHMNWSVSLSDVVLMQFTGLHDKSSQLKEIYEGDIIDGNGNLKGNIYESPQIYKEGTDCLIEGMGTEKWRSTESIAVGRGCQYTQ